MLKKIAFGSVGLLLLISPLTSSADILSDLQAQVQALLAQIAALQGQQNTSDSDFPTGTSASSCPNLSLTMQRGSRDAATGGQVSALQAFLANYYNLNDDDVVTGYFGATTHAYVVRFQQEHGLPAFGIVGSLTRAKIAQVCGGTVSSGASVSVLTPVAGQIWVLNSDQNTPTNVEVSFNVSNPPATPFVWLNLVDVLTREITPLGFSAHTVSSGLNKHFTTLYRPNGGRDFSQGPRKYIVQAILSNVPYSPNGTGGCVPTEAPFNSSTCAPGQIVGSISAVAEGSVFEIRAGGGTSSSSSLSVMADASSPATSIVPAGSTGVTLGAFRFTAAGQSVSLQKATFLMDDYLFYPGDLSQVHIYDGSTLVGSGIFLPGNQAAEGYLSHIILNQAVAIPANSYKVLTVKGDIPLVSAGARSGDRLQVGIKSAGGVDVSGTSVSTDPGAAFYPSSTLYIFKSFPWVSHLPTPTSSLTNGSIPLLRFKIAANKSGPIGIAKLVAGWSLTGATLGAVDMYAYTDAAFTNPIPGGPHLGGGASGGNSSTLTLSPSPIQIPAGQEYFFEVRGGVSGVTSGASMKTTLKGDAAYGMVGTWDQQKEKYMFLWSPNSAGTSVRESADWASGYTVPGLPENGITQALVAGGIISTPSKLNVGSPNGGENIPLNPLVLPIKWSSAGLKNISLALYRNDQWYSWIANNLAPSGKDVDLYEWNFGGQIKDGDVGQSIFKIYATGQKVDGSGYMDDKSDATFSFSGQTQGPVTVQAGQVLALGGETITGTWNSSKVTAKDWVGLVKVGATWQDYTLPKAMMWFYTDGAASGAKKITAPNIAGDYQLVYHVNDGYTELARSGKITVNAVPIVQRDAPGYTAGATMKITWNNPNQTNSKDWIGISKAGATWQDYTGDKSKMWFYTDGTAQGTKTLIAPPIAGQYQLIYAQNDGYTETYRSEAFSVSSSTITVPPPIPAVLTGAQLAGEVAPPTGFTVPGTVNPIVGQRAVDAPHRLAFIVTSTEADRLANVSLLSSCCGTATFTAYLGQAFLSGGYIFTPTVITGNGVIFNVIFDPNIPQTFSSNTSGSQLANALTALESLLKQMLSLLGR